MQELQTKEIKNARLAMVAFVGFIVAAQATGQVMDTPTSCSLVVCQCITKKERMPCSVQLCSLALVCRCNCAACCQHHPASADVHCGFLSNQVQCKGPLANLSAHLSNPFGNNITKNIGRCMIPLLRGRPGHPHPPHLPLARPADGLNLPVASAQLVTVSSASHGQLQQLQRWRAFR